MKVRSILILIFLIIICSGFVDKPNDALFIFGEGFSFKVNEPENWHCYTADAGRYGLNAYFCMGNDDFDSASVVMYIRVMSKENHSAAEHLQGDMVDFKSKYIDIKYDDFSVEDINYNSSSKIYIYNNNCDYLCYLEPDSDPKSPLYLIFVLSGPEEISPNYKNDFIKLVQSFQWLGYFHKEK